MGIYLPFSPLPFTSLLFSAICEASSDNHFSFCICFTWRWFWLWPAIQCYEPPSIVLHAFCLSDLISWIYLSLPHRICSPALSLLCVHVLSCFSRVLLFTAPWIIVSQDPLFIDFSQQEYWSGLPSQDKLCLGSVGNSWSTLVNHPLIVRLHLSCYFGVNVIWEACCLFLVSVVTCR